MLFMRLSVAIEVYSQDVDHKPGKRIQIKHARKLPRSKLSIKTFQFERQGGVLLSQRDSHCKATSGTKIQL